MGVMIVRMRNEQGRLLFCDYTKAGESWQTAVERLYNRYVTREGEPPRHIWQTTVDGSAGYPGVYTLTMAFTLTHGTVLFDPRISVTLDESTARGREQPQAG